MLKIPFITTTTYQFGALCFWFISYFLFSNTQHVINLNYFFLLLPTLLTIRFSELKKYISHPLIWILLGYLMITIGAAFHSGNPKSQAIFCLVVFLFYLTIYRLPTITVEQEKIISWAWSGVVLIYILYNSTIGWFNGIWHWGERLVIFSGFIDNPIYVADLLTCGLAMVSYNAIKSNNYAVICGAQVTTLFIGLVILQSRSMLPVWLIISLLTVSAIFFQNQRNQSRNELLWLTIPAIVLIYILYSDIGTAILARADSYRLEIWRAYIQKTFDCGIWIGCGMNDGINLITKDGTHIAHAHNIFVANFAKTGILGTIFLLALLINTIFYGLKRNYMAAWLLIAGTTALMFDGSSLIKSPNERWILIHLPLAYLIKLRIEERLNDNYRFNQK